MKRFSGFAAAVVMSMAFGPVQAEDFDGTKNLICAPVQSMDCMMGSECLAGTPDDIAFPAFLRIDFGKKVVIGPKRPTAIRHQEKTDDQLLLQGTEDRFGWTLALVRATGKMTVTLAHAGGAFVLFGSCTPQ